MALNGSEDRGSAAGPHEDSGVVVDAALAGVDLKRLTDDVARRLRGRGVTFGPGSAEFRVDPIPRVISAAEWGPLAEGLAQRVRALNHFVADVYADQRIVEAGVVPGRAITTAEYFEPELVGMAAPPATWIPLAGLDVVRDTDGEFKVLEDNVRTPSGLAYAIAARDAVSPSLTAPPASRSARSTSPTSSSAARSGRPPPPAPRSPSSSFSATAPTTPRSTSTRRSPPSSASRFSTRRP